MERGPQELTEKLKIAATMRSTTSIKIYISISFSCLTPPSFLKSFKKKPSILCFSPKSFIISFRKVLSMSYIHLIGSELSRLSVGRSVSRFVCRSVIIFLKAGKLHFHAPSVPLVLFHKGSSIMEYMKVPFRRCML